jgi:hypothetical protein
MQPTLTQIETEWRRSIRSSRATRTLLSWVVQEPVLAAKSFSALVDLRSGPQTDAIQLALARLARSDRLAGTTLLYSVVPGLKSLAGKLRTLPLEEPIDSALIRTAWEVIATYPVQRRPRHVAANVLLDTRRNVIAESRTALRVADALTQAGDIGLPDRDPSVEEIVTDWRDGYRRVHAFLYEAVAAGWIASDTAELAWRTWILDEPVGDAHAQLGLGYSAARGRLSRFSRRVQHEHPQQRRNWRPEAA